MSLFPRLFKKSLYQLNSIRSRSITMTSCNLEKVIEKLQTNPYYKKYSARITALQKTSPEEFLQRVEQQQSNKEKENKTKFGSIDTRQFSSVLNPKDALKDSVPFKDKKLEEIFKIDLVKNKEAPEIQCIWEEYHKSKEVLSATIPNNVYAVLQEYMNKYPTFIFPLPRSQGYEFIMCQNSGHTVHFTPLLAYQVHQENAPECLTMMHYSELSDKGIVLMKGEYDKNVLNSQEAQCLANQFQMYYSGKDQNKLKLLESFTKTPNAFKHMDLIVELENITLI